MSELIGMSRSGDRSSVPISDINIANVRHMINRDAHPHPAILTAITVILITSIYYLYVVCWKVYVGGVWVNSEGDNVEISHNRWSDVLIVGGRKGNISGKAIFLEKNDKIDIGVLYQHNIYWLNGSVWKKPIRV